MTIEEKLAQWEAYFMDEAKKKKKPYDSMTVTTGDIGYNIDQFNKRMGTNDNNNPSTEEAKARRAAEEANKAIGTPTAASPDGSISVSTGGDTGDSGASGGDSGSSGGGMGESLELKEEKRYVRRYYLKPQNIFCSNKTDILNALIELDNEDSTIYTLNNLGDEKDVTKLTNNDVIYYYEDGILYDKNRVKVVDYDLYIKHEENRPKINVNAVSDSTINKVYHDRVTGEMDEAFELNFDAVNAYGEKLAEGKETDSICCICGEKIEGYGNNAEPVKEGRCCDACNAKFILPARLEQMHDDRNE